MDDPENQQERRRHNRIAMDCPVNLYCGGGLWTTLLQDISLKGALLAKPAEFTSKPGTACSLAILLQPDIAITMEARLVYDEGDRLGFSCKQIDLLSISHLRRLVELNLADEALLQRELHELFLSQPTLVGI